ncbi:hypothetical protein AeMF1_015352 [Aphanomyces euteiches]|nr:hypothetical protein AeMF1_015352 [Aphanomyces euteiches]
MCEIEGRHLCQNISEHPRSLEEMEAMLKRLIQLPAYPLEAVEILETWKRAQKWTDEVTKALAMKIPFSRALAMEADGEACGIPPSSILKRQLNGRIQDTKRWLARTRALFKFDSSSMSFSLQGALEKNDLEDEKLRLVCTCQQVFNDKVKFVRCCGCSGLFHPVCVGLDPHGSLRSSYLCRECCHLRRRTYPHNFPRSDAVYCVCRESTDSVPMICCDFCDEWYHAKCIGISPTVMSNLEAYRCPGCAFRQGMSHLTSKRPLRPSLKQMIGLITRGDALQIEVPELEDLKALVSLGNDLLAEIIDFERHFLHQCSLESMLTHVDQLKEELQSKVSAVARYETLVILEPAHQKLRTMQWFLRACRLIFETSPAPRYSQLLILLSDAKQDKLEFSTLELQRFYHELEHNVERAIQWVAQVKALRMDSQNLMHLKDEAEEISQYLQLPDAAITNFNVAFKFHMGAR